MPTAKQLTIETVNLDDDREMDEFDRQVISAGMERVHAEIKELKQKGLLDAQGKPLVTLRVLTALYEIEKQPSHIAVEELLRLAENDEERTDGTGRSRLPRHKARAAQSGRLAGNADSRQHRVRPHEIETCGAISAAQSELTIY
jgi:hypothetical protein